LKDESGKMKVESSAAALGQLSTFHFHLSTLLLVDVGAGDGVLVVLLAHEHIRFGMQR
jgi:hypothetical protein